MPEIRIVLPVPLATWNRLLAMNQWERKKYRDWIHRAVSISIHSGTGWPTRTVSAEKLQSTGLSMQEYLRMIRPGTLKKSAIPRRKSGQKGKSKRR